MAIAERRRSGSDKKLFSICPFLQTPPMSSSSSSSTHNLTQNGYGRAPVNGGNRRAKSVSSVARSLLPPLRRLRLDPANNLYFPYEPRKQVRSAVRLKNTSKSHVAFKFQTTAPKSCYMRPPGGILGPGESLIATVFKFVEQPDNNEKQLDRKSKVKFKIMSLKVKAGIEYVPELKTVPVCNRFSNSELDKYPFCWTAKHAVECRENKNVLLFHPKIHESENVFDEQRDQVTVERILKVVFLDVERPGPAMEKLKRQLAEAEAALETRKKPPPETGPRVGGGLVIDEWKERREKYLAQQQVDVVDET